jgi:hypothetical protein
MTGYLAAMLVTSAVITAITFAWKISVHCVVASATVALVALTYNTVVLLGFALVALVAWSRVRLRAHTTAQVIAGTLLGAAAGALAFLAVSWAPGPANLGSRLITDQPISGQALCSQGRGFGCFGWRGTAQTMSNLPNLPHSVNASRPYVTAINRPNRFRLLVL